MLCIAILGSFFGLPVVVIKHRDESNTFTLNIKWLQDEKNQLTVQHSADEAFSGWSASAADGFQAWMCAYQSAILPIPTVERGAAGKRNAPVSWWESTSEAREVKRARRVYANTTNSDAGRSQPALVNECRKKVRDLLHSSEVRRLASLVGKVHLASMRSVWQKLKAINGSSAVRASGAITEVTSSDGTTLLMEPEDVCAGAGQAALR
jgi:hypothetical protein